MSKFTIDSTKPVNSTKNSVLKNNLQNIPTQPEINDFNNDTTRNITKIYNKKSIDRNRDIPRNNDRRNVRMLQDTTAVRQNRYDFSRGKYDLGYPRPNNYALCPQKISTIFQNGNTHFTTSTINFSYPFKHNLVKVSDISRLSSSDCACQYVDFSGNYILNWSLSSGGQLISSDNPQVTIGTFTFYASENYFNIYLYPKPSVNNSSYVHIRYRIPVRYRYAYGDWTFWESLLIENTLSETEFVKIVNCCGADINPLNPILL